MFKIRGSTMWILVAALLATAVKIAIALTTYGTDDVMLYFQYGRTVNAHGLAKAFQDPQFNLTPLAAGYPALLMDVLARNRNWFPLALKLPGIFCYLGTVLALVWLRSRMADEGDAAEISHPAPHHSRRQSAVATASRDAASGPGNGVRGIPIYALVLFAASPVSMLVDGFHGNLDSNMVFALVLAGCACTPVPGRNAGAGRWNWLVCAVCLAVACQVKVVGLLLAPVFWFFWMHRGRGWQFFIGTAVLVLLGWLPGFLANPMAFLSHVVAYGSVWGMWGFTFLLRLTGYEPFQEIAWSGLSRSQILVGHALKLVIVSAVMFASWRNRKGGVETLFSTIAFCWAVFFAFAPGLGVQYLLWIAPFLLVWNARWYVGITVLSTLVLVPYYHISCGGRFPWWRAFTWNFAPYYPYLVILWAGFLACAVAFVMKGGLKGNEENEQAR
jgi:hypothetical protein